MNDDFNNEIDETTRKVGRKTGKKVGRVAMKKAVQLGIKALKVIGRGLLAALKAILPYIAIPAIILIVATLAYFIVFEFVGTEKEYSKDSENEIVKKDDGIYYVKEGGITEENKAIRDYYKYISGQSYSKSVGKDKEVYNPDDEEVKDVKDYYERENDFNLAPNLLYALDEHLYNWTYKYSEQFIKPVNYDEDSFDLLPLVDEDGYVIVESEEEDIETGEKTGDKIVSVRDYGLGSILKYNEKENYERIEKIKGEYVARDVWDESIQDKRKVYYDVPKEFEIELEKEDIYLIDKATLFTGNIEYKYEKKDNEVEKLATGVGKSEKDKTKEYVYDIYEKKNYKTETYTDEETGEIKTREVYVDSDFYDLKMYRSDDSAVYENVPVVVDTITDNEDLDYFESYLKNFEAYVPEDVIQSFDIDERVDYDSHAFDDFLFDDYGFELGSGIEKDKFKYAASRYFDIIQEHAYHFDIDPYIMLAIMVQESGGDKDINKYGIMQIYNGARVESAVNRYGEKEIVRISIEEKKDVDKSVKWASAYYKRLLDMYDGNNYKAIQAYNMGEGAMANVKNANKEAWESGFEWLAYREMGRLMSYPGTKSINYGCMPFVGGESSASSIAGDSCYLENTLQYYAGSNIEDAEIDGESFMDMVSGWGSKFMNFIIPREKDELIPKFEHVNYLKDNRIKDVLGTTKALNDNLLFSYATSTESKAISFWDEGYMDSVGSIGASLQDILDIAPNSDGYLPPIDLTGHRISSYFGPRKAPLPGASTYHNGVDIAAPIGTPVYAIADGVVTFAKASGNAGNLLIIKHDNGTEGVYMHLSKFFVNVGDRVMQGDNVAAVGNTGNSTGAHLHFGFKINGSYVDPLGIITGE